MVDKFNFVPFRFYIHVSSIPCNQSMKLNFTKTAGCNDFIENANVKNGYGFKQIMCSIILKYNVTSCLWGLYSELVSFGVIMVFPAAVTR